MQGHTGGAYRIANCVAAVLAADARLAEDSGCMVGEPLSFRIIEHL